VTLGHELAGWIESLGEGVTGWDVGQPVAVYIVQGCGRCEACDKGRDNLCKRGVFRSPGVHYDGGIAEKTVVDARQLVPLEGVDPALASPYTDAGLTAYGGVEWARPHLYPGSTALVLGVGGLGHLGVQILAATSAARIIAVDIVQAKVELAKRLGADAGVLSGPDAQVEILDANEGRPVDVVLDFTGVQQTIDIGIDTISRGGMMVVVGMGGGAVPVVFGFNSPERRLPANTPLVTSQGGTRDDLLRVLDLARRNLVHIESTSYSLRDAPKALAALAAGELVGRAVINP
jgi:propanol-preferring alcohol dehydrogenase